MHAAVPPVHAFRRRFGEGSPRAAERRVVKSWQSGPPGTRVGKHTPRGSWGMLGVGLDTL